MRLHISLDDDIVRDLDQRIDRRKRSAFIASAVRQALDDERRWDSIEAALSGLGDAGHDWDADPGGWVRDQRAADARRVG